MNLNVEEMEETCPVIITTANEEAHGNKPVINPTMIGLSSFVSLNLPCRCPQPSECLCFFYKTIW